jgi:ubiquinone/menaquinone biosynthesis C-methylase UbiE
VSFSGDIADYYATHRRGFAPRALEFVVARLGVGPADLVVDLGCGTGQLALPLSSRVRRVLAIDPEPDMLAHGYRHAQNSRAAVSWMLGTDAEIPGLADLLGDGAVAAVTISNAIHLMDTDQLFRSLTVILRPGASVAVIANGTPIWLQDRPWSVALREFLQRRFGLANPGSCGTDESTRRRYAAELATAGFHTDDDHLDFSEIVTSEWIFGHVMSAMPPARLPPRAERPQLAEAMHAALRSAQPDGDFVEDVRLAVLVARRR